MNRRSPDTLGRLARGEWIDPDDGRPITIPIRSIAIEASLAGREADVVAPLSLGRRLAVVSDTTTRAVLGERVERALARVATILPVVLDGVPHADAPTVDTVVRASAGADALVAVGSGTINDLCKYAAAKQRKPYAVFPTAPSMNGYASKNAAITVDGHKMSLAAATPVGIFVDVGVLCAAPARMIRAGLGDSMCRSTAQADWLLSHRLFGTPYRSAPFAMLADDEAALVEHPESLLRGDAEAMRALARTLVLSGIGMTVCGGSHPASQGEHLISHYIDMFAPATREPYFHGEQVAVATLTMARIQADLLADGPPRLEPRPVDRDELRRRFGAAVGESCWREVCAKQRTADADDALRRRLDSEWEAIRDEVRRVTMPAERIGAILRRAGCPTEARQIGVTPEFYATAVRDARLLRDRYTFLDLAADCGHPLMRSG
jgi:glycerol-1-phosphate dehydrogenase [NAD(P)+]